MVQIRNRLSGFVIGRASVRAKVRAQPQQYKKDYNSAYKDDDTDMAGSSNNSIEMNFKADMNKPGSEFEGVNKVMVVLDFSPEAKNALEWALSHTVQTQDAISLLLVTKQGAKYGGHKAHELLGSMKKMCQMKCSGVHVEAILVEGKERGSIIVEEAKKQKVSLLVLGQKKRTLLSRLRLICSGRRRKTTKSVAQYCIQNANCMTVAVRRKSRKCGGYLITTKRHKNFWLLA